MVSGTNADTLLIQQHADIARVQTIDQLVFTATINGGLIIFDNTTGESFSLPPKQKELLGADVFALAKDRRGRIWLGSRRGLITLPQGFWII